MQNILDRIEVIFFHELRIGHRNHQQNQSMKVYLQTFLYSTLAIQIFSLLIKFLVNGSMNYFDSDSAYILMWIIIWPNVFTDLRNHSYCWVTEWIFFHLVRIFVQLNLLFGDGIIFFHFFTNSRSGLPKISFLWFIRQGY